MWTAKQVSHGLECGCVCPACNAPLIAKAQDSADRRPHFAHYRETDCRAGFESAVHRMAKQLIQDRLRVRLPVWDGAEDMPNPPTKQDARGQTMLGRRVEFAECAAQLQFAELEVARGDYIPDVTAQDREGDLLIEVRVHHAVDNLKRQRVQSERVRMVEIDLSNVSAEQVLDDVRFEQLVLDHAENRHWISCPTATDEWRRSLEDLNRALLERNRQIEAEERDLAARQASEIAQAKARAATKEANRESMRYRLRAPYESMLASLHELASNSRIGGLLDEYWQRDGQQAETILASMESSIAAVMRRWHRDAWVYRAHPVLWQASVFQKFVAPANPGDVIAQQDVVRWARRQFDEEPVLKQLFDAQYRARSDARQSGHKKYRIAAWFFTDDENATIPNFYEPFNDFFRRLVEVGVIRAIEGGPGRYTRCAPRPAVKVDRAMLQVLPTPVRIRRTSGVAIAPGAHIEHRQFGRGTVEKYLPASSHVYVVQFEGERDVRVVYLAPGDDCWQKSPER